ncbi:MAG: DUF11 domain-containing protein, partial [Methanosarcinales archaeon]|nr:DUF11 domain-containing protein [Methanosarcinales archaeon]
LKKDTEAQGLNAMKSEAEFSGQSRFRAVLKDKVDLDQEYYATYKVKRETVLTGVSKYDLPHLTVSKVGEPRDVVLDGVDTTLVEYTIRVENDGNRALGPVYVKDLFPPGTLYINASVKPYLLSSSSANWSLTHLGIGSASTIVLRLNTTGDLDSLVNRVVVTGIYGNKSVVASNYSVIEYDWLGCCPAEMEVVKEARVDPDSPSDVDYRITIENRADKTMVVNVTDLLPYGLEYVDSSLDPVDFTSRSLWWILTDLAPGEMRSIDYSARARWNGTFVNSVHVEGYPVGGVGGSTVEASATVVVGGVTEPEQKGGWQPPDWGFDRSANISDVEGGSKTDCANCDLCPK